MTTRKRTHAKVPPGRACPKTGPLSQSIYDILSANMELIDLNDEATNDAFETAAAGDTEMRPPESPGQAAPVIARINEFARSRPENANLVTAPTDVPFQLSRTPDRVFDIGAELALLPSTVIDALARDNSRAFLTEHMSVTDARRELAVFESQTNGFRGTRSKHWISQLSRWAGTVVTSREPVTPDSPPLRLTWTAIDDPQRKYLLAIFEMTPAFFVASVLYTIDRSLDAVYVGSFYMQSEQSHAADLRPQ